MGFWKPKVLRIRWIAPGRAYGDGSAVNRGDVVLREASLAQEDIDAGRAELTDAEVGSAPQLTPDRECWRCGGGGLGFADAKCRHCGMLI